MKRLSVVTAMVLGVSILTSEAMFAAPLAVHTPVHAMFSKDKLVKFNLRNATDAPIKVKAGDTDDDVAAGERCAGEAAGWHEDCGAGGEHALHRGQCC